MCRQRFSQSLSAPFWAEPSLRALILRNGITLSLRRTTPIRPERPWQRPGETSTAGQRTVRAEHSQVQESSSFLSLEKAQCSLDWNKCPLYDTVKVKAEQGKKWLNNSFFFVLEFFSPPPATIKRDISKLVRSSEMALGIRGGGIAEGAQLVDC